MKKRLIYLTGLLMAMADSVPGVSGGTIAFILGTYDALIENVYNLKEKTKRKQSIGFLSKLLTGWVIGFVFSVLVITSLVETHIYEISSMFIGFIIVSIPLTIKEELDLIKGNYQNLIYTLIGLVVVVAISYIGQNSNLVEIDMEAGLSLGNYIYVILIGMVAISSMLLPGISGSTVLIIFGVYFPVITAVEQVLHFDFTNIGILISLGLGILIGGALFIQVINYLLKHYRSKVVYTIQGLMIGSLYPIVLGPTTIEGANFDPLSIATFSIIGFIIGALIIGSIEKLKDIL